MAGNFLSADIGMPDLSKYDTTEAKLNAIQSYLYLLLENLRYTLRNLSMEDNFNESDLAAWVDRLEVDTVISNTVITQELYSSFGSIADLIVNQLRTDYKRAQNYLNRDTSTIDYIHIQNEELLFITAQTDGVGAEQLTMNGRRFWWTDSKREQMTSETETKWPVMSYIYTEMVKGSFRFDMVASAAGDEIKVPVLTLGAGTGVLNHGKATIVKATDGLDIEYVTTGGVKAGVYIRDDGYVDALHRRASLSVDTTNKVIVVKPEGTLVDSYSIEYEEDTDGNLTLTWPDGKSFRVEVV